MPAGKHGMAFPKISLEKVDQVWALLETLTDPEIPVISLREMGILRDVRHGRDGLEVVITPTYSGCPAMGQIEHDVASTLAAHGVAARIVVQLAPAWTTDWLSDAARTKLRDYGIAPPSGHAPVNPGAGLGVVQLVARPDWEASVPCPRCGSVNTTETSHFGSTACKALFRCLDCLEPFDHFKPH
jgi:ring-1,2-phenylacetyl-CoA epoxidase subunit PaaD